jgi:ribose-phosphate pyrophosphokinase
VVEHFRRTFRQAGGADEPAFAKQVDFQFSDSETCVRLEVEVAGRDVFLFQSLFDPVSRRSIDENYIGFLLAARACREFGASRVTGVLPYLAYARQDKPTLATREPTSAKLMADLALVAGVERLVTLQPHAAQIHGFYGIAPVTVLDMVPLFVHHYRHLQQRSDVIVVAPDAGAAKWVQQFCQLMDLPVALATKYRPRPEEAVISTILGDFTGKRVALILDDIISSGGTVYGLARRLTADKEIKEIYLGVAHHLSNESANLHLSELRADGYLEDVFVTNSVPQTAAFQKQPYVKVHDLSDTLSRVIGGIHHNRL